MLIGNARRAALLFDRVETLEQMRQLAFLMQKQTDPAVIAEYEKTIRIFGSISQRIGEMIEREDREGVPQKWVQYYQLMEKLDGLRNK